MSRDPPVVLFANLSNPADPVPDPTRATPGSCGLDLYLPEQVVIPPLATRLVRHQLAFRLPPGYFGQIHLRACAAYLELSIKAGLLDSDYHGEVSVYVRNEKSDEATTLAKGRSYWQLVIQPHFVGLVGK